MPFNIVRDDIIYVDADAIVNAANSSLAPGGGVCGTIFATAGYEKMKAACEAIGHCDVGNAVITPGFGIPVKYVIHAVGPIWQGGDQGEEQLLKNCYRNALLLAEENGCNSIAFPLISSGIYGYPKSQALKCAMEAISEFLFDHDLDVTLVIFDKDSMDTSKKLFVDIKSYIDEYSHIIQFVGGCLVVVVGIFIFFKNPVPQIRKNKTGQSLLWQDFGSMFGFTLANFFVVIPYILAFFTMFNIGLTIDF
ncbi:MAG: macro domain-containing protein, partial [Firmicutes bacterium]|nr:macro domain-containing protein [Bacillota bacterium]